MWKDASMAAAGTKDAYHHGDLRRAALDSAQERIDAGGAGSVTIRGIAAELGVTHTAIGHVFGSRNGLLTALAIEGYIELADRLSAAQTEGLLQVGLAYVRFGVERPAHFVVMFDTDLIEQTEEFQEASGRTWAILQAGVRGLESPEAMRAASSATVAAWSLMHGIVTLHNSGALSRAGVTDHADHENTLAIAEQAGAMLFGSKS